MNKKIGILTFQYPENRNFGAALQSYAVQNLFENFGIIVELIDYMPYSLSIKGKLLTHIEGKNFKNYSEKFLKISCLKITSGEEFKKLNEKYDVFSVGSDQVWRPIWWENNVKHYFFDFVEEDKKKIAYAASFGVDYWEGDERLTKQIKSLIKKFDAVSVREESGIEICKNIFDRDNVVCVLDPTLMISREEYRPILEDWKDKSHLKNKYIAHMLLDDTNELREGSKEIAKYLDANINHIKGKSFKILGKTITLYNKVSQWLTYLKDSELVITDSFHCTVFALIFHKKFVVVANPTRGIARLETLLKKVGLEDRFFTNINEVLKSGILDKDINYDEVDKKLEVHRKYSMEFLKKALED